MGRLTGVGFISLALAGAAALIVLILEGAASTTSLPQLERIVFVTIDTLRAAHLQTYGYPREASPFLDSLAARGVVFEHGYSASSHTAPSHATMFTSLYPFQHRVLRNHEQLPQGLLTVVDLARERGFDIAAFPSVRFLEGKVGFPVTDEARFDPKEPALSKRIWYRHAADTVERVKRWLEGRKTSDRFFIWIHFYDVHQWQRLGNIPEEHLAKMRGGGDSGLVKHAIEKHGILASSFKDDGELLERLNRYDARLSFVDSELRRLYEIFEGRGLNQNSLWIFTSDHGEGLGSHNYLNHGEFLYQEQLHIPLIFHLPSAPGLRRRVAKLVRTVDLLPTLGEFLGGALGHVSPPMQGQSLFSLIVSGVSESPAPQFSFAERRPKDALTFRKKWEEGNVYAIQSLGFKLIEHTNGSPELFALEEDPVESKNRAGQGIKDEEILRSELRRILALEKKVPSEEAQSQDVDPEALEELKSLGYM